MNRRQIKFRAWDEVSKHMYPAEELGNDQLTLDANGRGFVNIHSRSHDLSQFYPHLVPMQYTGITDREGREVYEGDIVHQFGGDDWQVVWLGKAAAFVLEKERDSYHWLLSEVTGKAITVVGNIYEAGQ